MCTATTPPWHRILTHSSADRTSVHIDKLLVAASCALLLGACSGGRHQDKKPIDDGDNNNTVAIDECATGTDDCHEHATCTDLDEGFSCACADGFTGDGRTCVDTNECESADHDCAINATCVNTPGSFDCQCPATFSGDGRFCLPQLAFLSFPPQAAIVGERLRYRALLNRPGEADYDLVQAPLGATLLKGGLLTWLPEPNQHGAHRFELTATMFVDDRGIQVVGDAPNAHQQQIGVTFDVVVGHEQTASQQEIPAEIDTPFTVRIDQPLADTHGAGLLLQKDSPAQRRRDFDHRQCRGRKSATGNRHKWCN